MTALLTDTIRRAELYSRWGSNNGRQGGEASKCYVRDEKK